MAHKKGVGSSRNGRDSGPKYLGVKRFAGEFVTAGSILVKQRGTKFHPGLNVRRASDDTLFTVIDGQVKFEHKNKKRYRVRDRKSTRLNSSHLVISYAVFCLKKKKKIDKMIRTGRAYITKVTTTQTR